MKIKFTELFHFILPVCFLFSTSILIAQDKPVTFKIIGQKNDALAFATVTVVNRLDSSKWEKKVADSTGKVSFKLEKEGQYIIGISSVNYQPIEKGITITGDQSVFTFVLEPLPRALAGVVVTSKKPLLRQEDDKTIIDPENLAASSTSGYEVIEKTPGLFVDQDGNIYISSMTPATVQINGREMKMSAADVATVLKSLPPNSIEKIEIVRTPSAKYDAASSGGIVNVVLKKGVKIGKTGSVTGGWQQGTYGNEFVGLNVNNNDGKKSSFFNLNYSQPQTYERIITDRLFAPDTMLSQESIYQIPGRHLFCRVQYFLSSWKKMGKQFKHKHQSE